jgi:hypothetical protein
MPPEFLEEMLDLRMEIAGLRSETPEEQALESRLKQRRDDLLTRAGELLEGESPSRLVESRRVLNATKYIQNLIRDLRAL